MTETRSWSCASYVVNTWVVVNGHLIWR